MQNQPKKILALDGGGIRGVITLGYLERIEAILRERYDNPDLRLCDHFDMMGGTSTGAIIAAGLSIGLSASEISKLYMDLGNKIFGKRINWFRNPKGRYKAQFDFKPLEKELKNIFGDITMGSDKIKTNLCIITKRADTLSTWPIMNNPKGKFFNMNRGMLLRKVVRASAAAPSYFMPQKIDVGGGEIGAFIDGGVSLANNPALQLFLVATLKEYKYGWETGEDNLSILSIGTGTFTKRYNPQKIASMGLLGWASMLPEVFMEDANYMNQTILQYLSNSPTRRKIDSEILDLKDDLLGDKAALTYARYNIMIETNELNRLGFNLHPEKLDSLRDMSESKNRQILYDIGKKAAKADIRPEHIV